MNNSDEKQESFDGQIPIVNPEIKSEEDVHTLENIAEDVDQTVFSGDINNKNQAYEFEQMQIMNEVEIKNLIKKRLREKYKQAVKKEQLKIEQRNSNHQIDEITQLRNEMKMKVLHQKPKTRKNENTKQTQKDEPSDKGYMFKEAMLSMISQQKWFNINMSRNSSQVKSPKPSVSKGLESLRVSDNSINNDNPSDQRLSEQEKQDMAKSVQKLMNAIEKDQQGASPISKKMFDSVEIRNEASLQKSQKNIPIKEDQNEDKEASLTLKKTSRDSLKAKQKLFKKISFARQSIEQVQDMNLIILGLNQPKTQLKSKRKPWLFYPSDTWKTMGWDLFISVILLTTCITTPFDLAFAEELDAVKKYVTYRYCIDFLFLIDIAVNFNTATQDEIFEVEDDRCQIAKNYILGWFLIDFLAIIPFDLVLQHVAHEHGLDGEEQGDTSTDYNRMFRLSRISKLYKLIKITRLIRLAKLMKQQNNSQLKKTWKYMRISKGLEKITFFFLMLMILCHIVSCLWIFAAKTFEDDEIDGDSWIEAGEFQDQSMGELYVTSLYFAVTTITTIGYGDISGNSTPERCICFFLHLIGVLSYSFASGSLTNIIANYDTYNDVNRDKINMLNRINKDKNLPQDLYYQLRSSIKNNYDPKEQTEILEFLNDLPYRLMVKSIMCIYHDHIKSIDYLNNQSENFLAWICPLFIQVFIPMDQYLYYETDKITEIYFMTKGSAGFVLPLNTNIVYIDILKGDYFGEIDLIFPAKLHQIEIAQMIDQTQTQNYNLVRQFTVQAIEDCHMFTIDLQILSRMHKQFVSQFERLFEDTYLLSIKTLKIKQDAIQNHDQALNFDQYKVQRRKSLQRINPAKSFKEQDFEDEGGEESIRKVNALYYNKCRVLKDLKTNLQESSSSGSYLQSDDSLDDFQFGTIKQRSKSNIIDLDKLSTFQKNPKFQDFFMKFNKSGTMKVNKIDVNVKKADKIWKDTLYQSKLKEKMSVKTQKQLDQMIEKPGINKSPHPTNVIGKSLTLEKIKLNNMTINDKLDHLLKDDTKSKQDQIKQLFKDYNDKMLREEVKSSDPDTERLFDLNHRPDTRRKSKRSQNSINEMDKKIQQLALNQKNQDLILVQILQKFDVIHEIKPNS